MMFMTGGRLRSIIKSVSVVSPQPVYLVTNEHHMPTVAEDMVFVPSRQFGCPMMAIPRIGTVLDMKITTMQK